MELTQAEPMSRAWTHDADAFADLVDSHKDLIVNYLARLTGSRDRAEDVAQETFVRFYQQRYRYREEGSLTAYLFRIATNLVKSEERRKRRWEMLAPVFAASGFLAGGSSNGHHPESSPQARALAREEHQEVTRAIASIDLIYRAPLVLREIEGLSYQEIADALGLSEGTVKSRLHRARQLLKEKLEPYWKGGR